MASLFLTQSDGSELELPLGSETITIGRDRQNDVRLDDDSISTFHAEILMGDGHHVLKDLGSTNGVRVNGERVLEMRLSDGDLLRFGQVRARYAGQFAESGPVAAAAHVPAAVSAPQTTHGTSDPGFSTGGTADPSAMGFGKKASGKNPDKAIAAAIIILTTLAGIAAVGLSFTMQ